MRARTGLSIFCLVLTACGARSEIRGALPDASVSDVIAPSCANGIVQIAGTGAQPDTIVLDGDDVYWHDATGIFHANKSGGAAKMLAQTTPYFWPDLAAFAVPGGQLFYGDGDAIGFHGGDIGALSSPGFATSASYVYAWSRDVLPTPLRRFAFDGTSVPSYETVAHQPIDMTFTADGTPCIAEDPGVECAGQLLSGLTATDIAVAGNDVFFTSNDPTNGARVMHLVMPTLKTTPIADTTGAFSLAQDDTDLFFTDGLGLRVRRVEGKTGPVVDVANVGPDFTPIDVVVDDACVYWTNAPRLDPTAPGAVMAAPKK